MLPSGDHTHTNNAGYSNGSSLPVEGLEINDVYTVLMPSNKLMSVVSYIKGIRLLFRPL